MKKCRYKSEDNVCERVGSNILGKRCSYNVCAVSESVEDIRYDTSALDTQVGGDHYKHFKIQPKEFFIANKLPEHKSTIIKRILRYDMPTGKGIEDLEKIKHEVDLIIEICKKWGIGIK